MLLGLPSTLPEATSGAIIGVIAAGVIRFLLNWNESVKRQMNLRRALIAELEASGPALENIDPETADVDQILSDLPRSIFDGNTDKIGELSKEEISSLSHFYSTTMSRQLDKSRVWRPSPRRLAEIVLENHAQDNKDDIANLVTTLSIVGSKDLLNSLTWLFRSYEDKNVNKHHLRRLDKRREEAIEDLEANLQSRTRIVLSKIASLLSRLQGTETDIRSVDLTPNQRMMLVAIAHLYKTNSFSRQDLEEKVETEEISGFFNEELTYNPYDLRELVLNNVLEKTAPNQYRLSKKSASKVLPAATSFPEVNNDADLELGWIP